MSYVLCGPNKEKAGSRTALLLLSLILFAELRQIRRAHRQQVEGRHNALTFSA
jgi:hypothetical protein